MIRSLMPASLLMALVFLLIGCSEEEQPPKGWPDGLLSEDGRIKLDTPPTDLGVEPDLNNEEGGPLIEVLVPLAGDTVLGEVLTVQAMITDPDGVDDQTVTVTLQGGIPAKMTITSTPNVYEALVDISEVREARLWVTASDLLQKQSSRIVVFTRDAGPKILFLSPEEDSRHRGSVSVQIVVADTKEITSFEVKVGTHALILTQSNTDPMNQIWGGTVKFDDKAFNPPLSGAQVITATAENSNTARAIETRSFFVDDKGPEFTVVSQEPGELIGGIINLEVEVVDLAGVLPSTVRCVIGNDLDSRTVVLTSSAGQPDTYTGQFDTRTLSQYDLWPVMSFRAADKLGNESHYDIQVGLDNGQPIIELNPPTSYYHGKFDEGILRCSRPFDPVGSDAVNDIQAVPQVIEIRARIEDQGNHVLSAPWIPISLVDTDTTWLYMLDDTTKALAVDMDGDGFCDEINPEIIPLGSSPKPGDAVAVNIKPVKPSGVANFMPPLDPEIPLHPACSYWGSEIMPPQPLCVITPLTVATFYTNGSEPAIYSIPPMVAGAKSFKCLGLPFDFLANNFTEGWACAAVVADDNLGNRGVSPPLRLYVDYSLTYQNPPQPPPLARGPLRIARAPWTRLRGWWTPASPASSATLVRPPTAITTSSFPSSSVRRSCASRSHGSSVAPRSRPHPIHSGLPGAGDLPSALTPP